MMLFKHMKLVMQVCVCVAVVVATLPHPVSN